MMTDHTDFIMRSTLLFIASRSRQGKLDVSPRGGQPSVVEIRADGCLLLPDYRGNNRLDTIGNVLSDPRVELAFLNKGSNSYLNVSAVATVSTLASDLGHFPADDNRPVTVMVLKPVKMRMVACDAFEKAGFWLGPDGRKPPLDLMRIVVDETARNMQSGIQPVPRDQLGEDMLVEHGLRSEYGAVDLAVRQKAFKVAGVEGAALLASARLLAVAVADAEDGFDLKIVGHHDGFVCDGWNGSLSFHGLGDVAGDGAEIGILAIEPGRCENIRVNGSVVADAPHAHVLNVATDEIFYHCSAAFTRSRIWAARTGPSWTGRRVFRCVEMRQECEEVRSFILEPADDAPLGPTVAGQFVMVSLKDEDAAAPRQRCYSISGRPGARRLRITVRRLGKGGLSDALHEKLRVGTELSVWPPAGRFVHDNGSARSVALISAGVGVTPMLAMLDELMRSDFSQTVHFIHGAKNSRHHALRNEAARLCALKPSTRSLTVYSQPDPSETMGVDYDCTGRITAGMIASVVKLDATDFYICGPDSFMADLAGDLAVRGVPPQRIHMEAFGPSSAGAGAASQITAQHVHFTRSNIEAEWTPACGTLLDLAIANNVPVTYACRVGECGSCVQRLLDGSVSYPEHQDVVLGHGQVMMCQATPCSELKIDL